MPERQRINILMARKVAGEATAVELEELEQLLSAYPEWQYAFTIVEDIHSAALPGAFTEEEEQHLQERGWQQLTSVMQQPSTEVKKIFPWKMVTGIAATVLVLIGMWQFRSPQHSWKNEVVTKTGSRSSLTLPDGSRVVLNACSRLQYDADGFLRGKREVILSGEAFFDVKQDAGHPFLIHTGQADIRVLGTSFNVKAYQEDGTVETTLLTGKVEVLVHTSQQRDARKMVLEPSQKLIIARDGTLQQPALPAISLHHISVKPTNNTGDSVHIETAWIDNRLEFEKMAFGQLAHDLERWYNVTIHFRNDKYKEEVFTGAFKNQRLEDVLQALQLTSGFHYEWDKSANTVNIW